uniref:Uncharacterized protein n=1 Tax=Malurus cyaneus samueli TaxID=2593467 RepID=A0A8C5T7B8_9PASS
SLVRIQNTFCPEGGVCKHGFLIKSPPLQLLSSQNSWKRRLFVLSKSSKGNYILKYLKGQHIKGSIAVDQIISIEVGISDAEIMETVRKMFKCLPEQVMSISTGSRCYYLIGSSSSYFNCCCKGLYKTQCVINSDGFGQNQIKKLQSHWRHVSFPEGSPRNAILPSHCSDWISCMFPFFLPSPHCSVSQWTGPGRLGCLFNHGDHVVAVNDLQPQGVEEAYFFISRSARKEVSLANLKVINPMRKQFPFCLSRGLIQTILLWSEFGMNNSSTKELLTITLTWGMQGQHCRV